MILFDGLIVLLGQDFGGGHQRGLHAVVDGHQHGADGNHRFAGSHIALDQAVHLNARLQVCANIGEGMFLSFGQLETGEFR
jgi:hypothetical protein